MATLLFKAYPKTDYDDPKAALATMVAVLSGYSEAIVREVTSPETGLQRRSKFPPRVSEIVEACDAAAARVARFSRYQKWGSNNEKALEGPKGPRPTKEEMLAKYGVNYGLGGTTRPNYEELVPPLSPQDIRDRNTKAMAGYSASPELIKALTK